ncbi:MAG: hypothetical protein RIQ96_1551 [Pseudomonadota bacterium]
MNLPVAGLHSPAHAAPGIDWRAPWWDGLRENGQRVMQAWQGAPQGVPLDEALNGVLDAACTAQPAPQIRFVPQSALPEGCAYEAHLWQQRECPTRENLHDFLNGLMWLRWPQAKRRINELQAAEIARHGIGPVRGAVRDALTLLDENGVLLQAPEAVRSELLQALRARQWQRLFVDLRPLWQQARLWIVGHALLEKLVQPRKDITAHLWWDVACDAATDDAAGTLDAALAHSLTPQRLARKPFLPLPVLGVPRWWAANAEPGFYDDAAVFRPARAAPA